MDKREIRKECYKEMVQGELTNVESILNQINRLKNQDGIIDEDIIEKDFVRACFDLELALAGLCILIRKMDENLFISIDEDTRKDVNSIIHSNKFEYYDNDCLYVYSKKGKEEVFLNKLLNFSKNLIDH